MRIAISKSQLFNIEKMKQNIIQSELLQHTTNAAIAIAQADFTINIIERENEIAINSNTTLSNVLNIFQTLFANFYFEKIAASLENAVLRKARYFIKHVLSDKEKSEQAVLIKLDNLFVKYTGVINLALRHQVKGITNRISFEFVILLEAVKRNSISIVNKLVSYGVNAAVCVPNQYPYSFYSPLVHASSHGYIEIIKFLLEKGKFPLIEIQEATHKASANYFIYPERKETFDAIYKLLLPFYLTPYLPKRYHIDNACLDEETAYTWLFEQSGLVTTAEEYSKICIAKIYALLSTPTLCEKYLKQLNCEFNEYCKQSNKVFSLPKEYYYFVTINGLKYPLPTDKWNNQLKKHHALQEFLVLLLQSVGIGQQANKWVGYIPQDDANHQISSGYFFAESRLGLGLFHGKLSHMLQFAIIIYAIKNGDINLTYDENKKITFQDILKGLVTPYNDKLPWGPVLDTRDFGKISFTDPLRLISILMYEGEQLNIQAISDALIHSFCKGFNNLYLTIKKEKTYADISLENFIHHLNHIELSDLFLPDYLFNADLKKAMSTHSLFKIFNNQSAAIIKKEYQTNLSAYSLNKIK